MRWFSLLIVLVASLRADAQKVALSFDDLPEHGDLPPHVTRLQVARSILQTLKRERMPPVYGFVNGVALEDTPSEKDVLKAWRSAGQPLGSHTYSHADLSAVTLPNYKVDIARNEPLLKRLMGANDWQWFRYPYLREGDTTDKRDGVREYLQQHGYRVAQVSLNFDDWAWNDPYARCVQKQDKAALRWLHDSYLAAADDGIARQRALTREVFGREISYVLLLHIGPFDAKMLPELIGLLRTQRFRFISLPAAMSDPAYRVLPDVALLHGVTFEEQVALARHLPVSMDVLPFKRLDAVCR